MSKRVSGTEIVGKLRQADVLIAQGKTLPETIAYIVRDENTGTFEKNNLRFSQPCRENLAQKEH
jgi:hypothetical protein